MTTAPKRRWPRFTLRTLFVVVTVLAVGIELWQRADRLQKQATAHKFKAIGALLWQSGRDTQLPPPEELAIYLEKDAYFRALAGYHKGMCNKCLRAVWRPWVQLQDDPVEPSTLDLVPIRHSPDSPP